MDLEYFLLMILIMSSYSNVGLCESSGDGDETDPAMSQLGSLLSQDLQQGLGGLLQSAGLNTADATSSLPCVQKLIPCQPFLHSPSPPDTCCLPLKTMIQNDTQCLCHIFNNPDILKSLNITQDDALKLPNACAANADISICKDVAPISSPPATPRPSAAASGSSGSSSSDLTKPPPPSTASKNAATGISLHFGGSGFIAALFIALLFSPIF